MPRLWASSRLAAVVLPLGIALLACSPDHDVGHPGSPYRAEILEAAKTVGTDFERSVLEDGAITRAEYVEASQRYVDCVKGHGIDIAATDTFGVNNYTTSNLTAENEKYLDSCTYGTIFVIEGLYSGMVKNPDKADFKQLVVSCLIKSGLAPQEYTVDDFLADMPDGEEPTFPFDGNDPRAVECLSNPQTHL